MTRQRTRGFAIVSAIFILVVLAVLGAAIVNISTTQQIGSAQDIQGARAYQAARAGIEWGLYRVLQDANFASNTTDQNTNQLSSASQCQSVSSAAPTTTSFTLGAASLNGFTVTVNCYASHDSTNKGPWMYFVTATACNQPNSGACPNTASPSSLYVERRLSVAF